MPSLASLESSVVEEYNRRCWTEKAKSQKYLRIYSLLQQASRASPSSPDSGPMAVSVQAKHAQLRSLMARVCLAKLACPVASALHSLEACVGFAECHLYTHAAQCLLDALAAVREERPKYGSIAAAIAALKAPLLPASSSSSSGSNFRGKNLPHLQLPASSLATAISTDGGSGGREGPELSSVNGTSKSVYDASHTVSGFGGRGRGRAAADTTNSPEHASAASVYHLNPLAAMFLPSQSSATFGPSLATTAPSLRDAVAMFNQRGGGGLAGVANGNGGAGGQGGPHHPPTMDTLQRFFDDTTTVAGGRSQQCGQQQPPASHSANESGSTTTTDGGGGGGGGGGDPASRFAQRFTFVLLQLVLHVTRSAAAAAAASNLASSSSSAGGSSKYSHLTKYSHGGASSCSSGSSSGGVVLLPPPGTLIAILRASLDLAQWLAKRQSLHVPDRERQFDFASAVWTRLLSNVGDAATNSSSGAGAAGGVTATSGSSGLVRRHSGSSSSSLSVSGVSCSISGGNSNGGGGESIWFTVAERIGTVQAGVRVELATLLVRQWIDQYAPSQNSLMPNSLMPPNTTAGRPVVPVTHTPSTPADCGGASAAASPSDDLDEVVQLLESAVDEESAWMAASALTPSPIGFPSSSSLFSSSSSSSSGSSLSDDVGVAHALSRLDHALLSHLAFLLSHSRVRLRLAYPAILEHDSAQCQPRGLPPGRGRMLFGPAVYCPQVVRQFWHRLENYLAVDPTADPSSSSSSHPPPPPGAALHHRSSAAVAVLRSCWGLLQVAGEVGRTLDGMFGIESRPPVETPNTASAAATTTTVMASPQTKSRQLHPPASSAPPKANDTQYTRVRIARRQMRAQLKNSLLNEYDAIVALYRKRLEEAACTASSVPAIFTLNGEPLSHPPPPSASPVLDTTAGQLVDQLFQKIKIELQTHCDRDC